MERKEAAELGLKKYNTGRMCANGHNSDRYTGTGSCMGCINTYQKRYKAILINRLVERKVKLHVDDWPALDAYVIALKMEREANRGFFGEHHADR